jgi:hypothetical protein
MLGFFFSWTSNNLSILLIRSLLGAHMVTVANILELSPLIFHFDFQIECSSLVFVHPGCTAQVDTWIIELSQPGTRQWLCIFSSLAPASTTTNGFLFKWYSLVLIHNTCEANSSIVVDRLRTSDLICHCLFPVSSLLQIDTLVDNQRAIEVVGGCCLWWLLDELAWSKWCGQSAAATGWGKWAAVVCKV